MTQVRWSTFISADTDKMSHKRQSQKEMRGSNPVIPQLGNKPSMQWNTTQQSNKQTTDLTTIWVDLKYIMQSKRNQTQKARCRMISFIWNSGRGKTVETENRSGVWFSKVQKGNFWNDENILGLVYDNDYTAVCIYQNSQNYTLKMVYFALCKL